MQSSYRHNQERVSEERQCPSSPEVQGGLDLGNTFPGATIPATSCSAERSFSTLKELKTYLRNTMGQERLRSLAMCAVERDTVNQVLADNLYIIIDRYAEGGSDRKSYLV